MGKRNPPRRLRRRGLSRPRWAPQTSTRGARGWSSSSSSSPDDRARGLLPPAFFVPSLVLLPQCRAASLFLVSQPPHHRFPPPLRLAALVVARRPVRSPVRTPSAHALCLLLLETASNAFFYGYYAHYVKGLLPLQNAVYCWSQPYSFFCY